jgi:hypothetical protein
MKRHDISGIDFGVVNRREFLASIGAVAGSAGLAGLSPFDVLAQAPGQRDRQSRTDRFSRIFDLPPFAQSTSAVQRALMELGAPGGLMDAKDPLTEGPIRLITNPELSPNNRDSSTNTAGMTFLGQFLDHDLTFDATSVLGVPTPLEDSENSRSPGFDLDSVYGGGPVTHPQLYDSSDRSKFRVESGGLFEDLPRGSDSVAIIADPRNDENLVISGLHAAFLLFHNRVVDRLRRDGEDRRLADADRSRELNEGRNPETEETLRQRNVFNEARRIVTWHYQWIILHQFLPAIIGSDLVDDILSRGARFFTPKQGEQSIPVEFSAAAYRFGHSMVRPSYRANLAGDLGQPFFGFIFDPAAEGQTDPADLRGRCRASRRFVGWQTFFNFGGDQSANVRPSKMIDTKLSSPLFNLPFATIASGDPPTSLAQRNLLRHLTWSVPSGQAIAEAMRIPTLTASQLSDLQPYGVGLERSTPLLYYILKEAEVGGGGQLVGVGARIVGEVFISLL